MEKITARLFSWASLLEEKTAQQASRPPSASTSAAA
jgi:hypothetical protein